MTHQPVTRPPNFINICLDFNLIHAIVHVGQLHVAKMVRESQNRRQIIAFWWFGFALRIIFFPASVLMHSAGVRRCLWSATLLPVPQCSVACLNGRWGPPLGCGWFVGASSIGFVKRRRAQFWNEKQSDRRWEFGPPEMRTAWDGRLRRFEFWGAGGGGEMAAGRPAWRSRPRCCSRRATWASSSRSQRTSSGLPSTRRRFGPAR